MLLDPVFANPVFAMVFAYHLVFEKNNVEFNVARKKSKL